MIVVPNTPLNVGSLVLNQSTSTIDWSGIRRWVPNAAEGQPPDHVCFYNESGTGFIISLPGSGQSFVLPAGAWSGGIELTEADNSAVGTAQNLLTNPPVTLLFVEYYRPGEPAPPPVRTLGNSPTGLSATNLPVTQVIQDGQTVGQTIVESTPTGQGQSILMTTDGKLILAPKLGGSQKGLLVLQQSDGSAAYEFFLDTLGELLIQVFPSTKVYKLDNNGTLTVPGALLSLGGQASAGSFGASVIVAQALRIAVTTTGLQTILSYTPAANGFYRVSGYVEAHPSVTSNLAAQVQYSDDNGSQIAFFYSSDSSIVGNNPTELDGAVGFGAIARAFSLAPLTFYALTSAAIQCQYNDPSGVPNDHVWFLIERLA